MNPTARSFALIFVRVALKRFSMRGEFKSAIHLYTKSTFAPPAQYE
jgi:hypothetical protein